jgi:hypothetical protein
MDTVSTKCAYFVHNNDEWKWTCCLVLETTPAVTPQHCNWPVRVVEDLLAVQFHNNFQCLVHMRGNNRRGLSFVSNPPEKSRRLRI